MNDEIEIVPNISGTDLFTPEEYEAFRVWWQEVFYPEIMKLENKHIPTSRTI